MAVANRPSSIILGYNAIPRVLPSGYIAGAHQQSTVAIVPTVATDNIGSIYSFMFVPSSVMVTSMQVANDATTAGVWQAGLYANSQQTWNVGAGASLGQIQPGGIPVTNAQQLFSPSISTASAQATWVEQYNPATLPGPTLSRANLNLRVWELLGLTADPDYMFILALTATTAPTAVGNIAIKLTWSR